MVKAVIGHTNADGNTDFLELQAPSTEELADLAVEEGNKRGWKVEDCWTDRIWEC